VASRSRLRASDADRDQVAERLRKAAAEGRLLAEELEQRLASALRARTYGELDSVVADLPAVRHTSRPTRPLVRAGVAFAVIVVAVIAVAVAALVITGLLTVWAFCVLIMWWCFGRRRGYRYRRMMRPGGPWQVTRTVRQADRRAWL
jgi:Flp pilus assembly protein TadB